MRAFEFLNESASVGATAASNVATAVKPLKKGKNNQTFFGADKDEFPKYGDTSKVSMIRRGDPPAKKK